jgi:ADP-ribose pyrophosphatase YjhB (NUDIX family)
MMAARFSRAMLLGVRGIVADDANRIYLVRHSYVEGWHFPGGGVERGETLIDALARELEEEGNIILDGPPILHGIFFNKKLGNRDHIGVYLVRQFHQTGIRAPDYEIVESGFFPLDQLPDGLSTSTRARLAEVFEAAPISPRW